MRTQERGGQVTHTQYREQVGSHTYTQEREREGGGSEEKVKCIWGKEVSEVQ